jgi:beta-phosphoglucomutase
MLLASKKIETVPANCVVIEDSFAGIQAASVAGIKSVGVGDKMLLHNADYALPETKLITFKTIKALF